MMRAVFGFFLPTDPETKMLREDIFRPSMLGPDGNAIRDPFT
jgi:hypothetical protein